MLTSPANQRIQSTLKLRRTPTRRKCGLILCEGARELSRGLDGGFELKELFWCAKVLSPQGREVLERVDSTTEVSASVFKRLAIRESTDGVVGVFSEKTVSFSDLDLPEKFSILCIQGVGKPGNLGALARTADATGCSAVVLIDQTMDPWGPNVVRASLGTIFTVPVILASQARLLRFCAENGISLYTTALISEATPYHLASYADRAAIVLGSEADGLDPADWQQKSKPVFIPMAGSIDSLNLAVAGAVLMYEVKRQHGWEQPQTPT